MKRVTKILRICIAIILLIMLFLLAMYHETYTSLLIIALILLVVINLIWFFDKETKLFGRLGLFELIIDVIIIITLVMIYFLKGFSV